MKKFTRRDVNRGMLMLGLGAAAGTFAGTASARAQEGTPQRGGTFNAVHINEPASMDPMLGNNPGNDARSYNLFSERLLRMDPAGDFHPWLAESWELSEDAKSVTFHLRSGIRFQDGTDFNAEAVKYNLDRNRVPTPEGRTAPYLIAIESVEVVDDLTVTIHLTNPSAAFLSNLATEAGQIVSPTAIEELGEEFSRSPVGTGPFRLTAWSSGRIEAERWDGYWGRDEAGEQLPYLDRVVFTTVPQAAVQLVQMRSGGTMWADNVLPQDTDDIEADPNIDLVPTMNMQTAYTAFNCEHGPFADNIELRKAVSHAINREALAEIITGRHGGPAICIEAPTSWATGPELVGHTYDPDLAREAYANSGHSGPITITIIQRDPDGQVAQLIQAMCAQVGIDLQIEVRERQAWGEQTAAGNFQMTLQLAGTPNPDPDRTFSQYYARTAAQNYSRFEDEVIFEAVDQARIETDRETRRLLYIKAQQQILDQYYQTFHYYVQRYTMRSPRVSGMKLGLGLGYVLDETWIES